MNLSLSWQGISGMLHVYVVIGMIYHIISYIISYHIISYHIISYHIISYHIISYHIIPYLIISYRIVLYRIISYYITLYYIADGVHILLIFNIRMAGQPLQVAVATPIFSVAVAAAATQFSCTLLCN